MMELNEAWRVLSDAARRAAYDASLRPGGVSTGGAGEATKLTEERYPVTVRPGQAAAARFPLRPVLAAFVLLCGVILIFGARASDRQTPAPDWRIEVGSCVRIAANLDAVEVECAGAHDGVARLLVPFDTSCPIDTETHRDQQGLGNVCVDRTGA